MCHFRKCFKRLSIIERFIKNDLTMPVENIFLEEALDIDVSILYMDEKINKTLENKRCKDYDEMKKEKIDERIIYIEGHLGS